MMGAWFALDWPDRKHNPLMMGKQEGRQIKDLLPRAVFAVDKPHTADELFAAHDLGVGIDPFAGHVATRVARGNLDHPVMAYALRLTRIRRCVDVQHRSVCSWSFHWCRRKPDRGPDTLAAFAVGLKVQIFLAVECGQSR